jgi:hypothetical protein
MINPRNDVKISNADLKKETRTKIASPYNQPSQGNFTPDFS